MKRLLSVIIIITGIFHTASAQNHVPYAGLVYPEAERQIISFLADDIAAGRPSGTTEQVISEHYIIGRFKANGLKPFNWKYTQSFHYDDTLVLRNIMGVVPAVCPSDEYVIVSAHYDHLGKLNNTIYNGADDNASGVAALISLAGMFSQMHKDGSGPHKNILFIAFDGKELSMAGSDYFVKTLSIPKEKILCNINMDILGSTLAPIVKSRPDYMIILGENTLPKEKRGMISNINERNDRLYLDFSFYGSHDFTEMMYELGDHYSFARAGIPALLFTSGFHQLTYKPDDDVNIIDFDVLCKRILLIFNTLYHFTR